MYDLDLSILRKKLPSFLVIGTYRAGTTWLHHVLSKHPNIFLPWEKETFYFSKFYYRGLNWYLNFYKDAPESALKGEVCPAYLSDKLAPQRIKKVLGDVKLIVILRNPFEQIISMYKHHLIRGEQKKKFKTAIIENGFYIYTISYADHLKNYFNFFPRDLFLILKYDLLKQNKVEFLRAIYKFLGVPEKFPDCLEEKVNLSSVRFLWLEKIIAKGGEFLRKHNLYFLKQFLKKIKIVDTLKKLNQLSNVSDTSNYIEFFPKEIVRLINAKIEELEVLLNIDLNNWKLYR